MTEKTHQTEVIKTAIKDNKTLDNEEIKKVLKKNKVDINNIKIENNNEQIRIVNPTPPLADDTQIEIPLFFIKSPQQIT